MHLYLATDLEPADAARVGSGRTRTSDCSFEWRPWRDAVAAAERGEIRDAKSLVGLFWLARVMDAEAGSTDAPG